MTHVQRFAVLALTLTLLRAPAALAEQPQAVQPAMDPAKAAAMEAAMKAGSPGEAHKALEPLAGTWTYESTWWMEPGAEPMTMTGTAEYKMIYGGRFLKQKVTGDASGPFPAFEGTGLIGYDNIRKEYTSIWFDSMATGIMVGTAQYDPATKTFTEQSTMSCPMTGETHRPMRSSWTLVDHDHMTYETSSRTPDGQAHKMMEIRYTRTH